MRQPNDDSPKPEEAEASDAVQPSETPTPAPSGKTDVPVVPRQGPPSVPPPGFPPSGADAATGLAPEAFAQRRRFPVLGASLWIFGALLWAYLIMGEWVIHLKLPEGVGVLVVAIAYGVAWFTSVRELGQSGSRWKLVVPGLVAVVLFAATLLLVSGLFGSSRRSTIAAVTMSLWFFSAAVYVLGRHLRARSRVNRTRWQAAGSIALWIVSGLVTLVSLIATMARA